MTTFQEAGEPVVSVDVKKKELVGDFKNAGSELRPIGEPEPVRVYDFVLAAGRATPYGIYDITQNEGWVSVGADHDTAAFAVQSIRRWWEAMVLASASVSHLPPRTSKWSKIEHRLFSHISMNWRGTPLIDHETIVSLIGATTTTEGLRVRAELDRACYPKGIKMTSPSTATTFIPSGTIPSVHKRERSDYWSMSPKALQARGTPERRQRSRAATRRRNRDEIATSCDGASPPHAHWQVPSASRPDATMYTRAIGRSPSMSRLATVTLTAIALLSAPALARPAAAPVPANVGDTDGDGFIDTVDLCPTTPGPSNGCPSEAAPPAVNAVPDTVAAPVATTPAAMTSEAARRQLDAAVAPYDAPYPRFMGYGGPYALRPAIDALVVKKEKTREHAQGLAYEAEAAYSVLKDASEEQAAAEAAYLGGMSESTSSSTSRFGMLRASDDSAAQRFVDTGDAKEAARAVVDATDLRLVEALQAMIDSNDAATRR